MTEVSRKDFSACLFDVTDVGFKIVSVCVEVPNPGSGFGTFGKLPGEKPWCSEFFIIDGIYISIDWLVIRSWNSCFHPLSDYPVIAMN